MSHHRLVVVAVWLTASVVGSVVLPSVAGAPAGSLASLDEARIDDRGAAARIEDAQRCIAAVNLAATRLAVEDMMRTFGDKYPNGRETLAKLVLFECRWSEIAEGASRGDPSSLAAAEELIAIARAALLANPLLDDPTSPDGVVRLLAVRRGEKQLGLPQNWEGNSSLPRTGFDNQLMVVSGIRDKPRQEALFAPTGGRFVGDVDLHFDARRLLFSMPSQDGPWRVYELDILSGKERQIQLIEEADVDNYDACYLPSNDIVFTSTAPFVGVPCVTGASPVANLYLRQLQGGIRRLTFEQDHDWCPTVLNDGRVLYLRWEYADLPHFASRILFSMNPDGTQQRAFYGSNSYWPNSMFYALPLPDHPTKFVAVVGGHHGVARAGELVLFDAARGNFEADGALQRIPGRGEKVESTLRDRLVDESWPKFLHPYPLSDKYFLVTAKPEPHAPWGIYLVDIFDNMTLLHAQPGYAFLEPIPLRPRNRPPVIADRVDTKTQEAVVHIGDIYSGEGLVGVPRGAVRQLRIVGYGFAYRGMGGQVNRVGLDGPWDVKRVLGTVPVETDGSAHFRVPANTPITLQPLDGEGKALQLMRSWLTAMPGETVSCVGCHDSQHRVAAPASHALALRRGPSPIAPWYGPPRGFSFTREVQPILDRHCIGCHDGQAHERTPSLVDFRNLPGVRVDARDPTYTNRSTFPPSYLALRQFVRTPTIESDMHLLSPAEYHADSTRLARLLTKGHHGVSLNAEEWSRLITWIDLNTPAYGSWSEIVGDESVRPQHVRRREMNQRYANLEETAEEPLSAESGQSPIPATPLSAEQTIQPDKSQRQAATTAQEIPTPPKNEALSHQTFDLGDGVTLELIRIPAGRFRMGDPQGHADESPVADMHVASDFWMGAHEVTNEQFAKFRSHHDSRMESGDFLHFSEEERGYRVNYTKQPVCRVSCLDAKAFCRWLSERTGRRFELPTETQWEYACRAGSSSPVSYGAVDADFSRWANLADERFKHVATYGWNLPSGAIPRWRPGVEGIDDGHRVSAPVGTYAPNAFGLYDMHGNVAEWTNSTFRSYPFSGESTPSDNSRDARMIVRGGSWYDRPQDARSAYRWHYPAWQKVFDVGFRVAAKVRSDD